MTTAARAGPAGGPGVGPVLREWRRRRRLSQLALALRADVSQRHLSFVESGRAGPSREMVLRLAAALDLGLRERNRLLVAAGYAPLFPEHSFGDPALGAVRGAVERVLAGHEPFPAVAVDRYWTLLAANRAAHAFMGGADEALLQPPVNVLRLSLHPRGLAPRIINLPEWRAHLLERLRRQAEASADPAIEALLAELEGYAVVPAHSGPSGGTGAAEGAGLFVPLQLASDVGTLSLISTTTVFGTPTDVTIAELALECFFPADAATAERLRRALGAA